MKNTFYCQNACGSEDFSIEEWNKVSQELELTNLSEKEKDDILFPKACDKQCFDCMAIVGKKRLETFNLIHNRTKPKGL